MPEEPLDPTEALRHIRVLVEASSDQVYGTPAEPVFREIRSLLDKALPPKRAARKPKPDAP